MMGLLVTGPVFTQKTAPSWDAAPTVLFVCEHGAAKSIIAAAEFNKVAEQRGLPYRAVARGTHPDPAFSPKVISGLRADGLATPEGKPMVVTDNDVSMASRVVTLGCKLPQNTAVTDWAEVPSPGEDFAAASSAIKKRVEMLLDELSAKGSRR
jgi:protein-tyrosine-phosphatase